jgi:hypothetical protein
MENNNLTESVMKDYERSNTEKDMEVARKMQMEMDENLAKE